MVILDLNNPDFFPMGQPFSYDFFPGVHHSSIGQPPSSIGVDNSEFPMPPTLPTPSSLIDPLRLHSGDHLGLPAGLGGGSPFLPTSAPPPHLGGTHTNHLSISPGSMMEDAISVLNSNQSNNQRMLLPSPDMPLPPSDRFLSSLSKQPRFRNVFEDNSATVW